MSAASPGARPVSIAVINAGVSNPSSTRLLADRITQKVIDSFRESGTAATVRSIDLGALAVDDQLRPLFAFLRALPMPTSLYAAPEDWGSADLSKRIARAAGELAVLLRSDAGRDIADGNWSGYRHQFGGNATRAERTVADVDFDTDLMRLAAGGASRPAADGTHG